MEDMIGLLRIRVGRGINLVVRDSVSSDPFLVITKGEQKVKTSVIKNNCNPEWNEELTLSIKDPNVPIILSVHDKDTFTNDDKMGEAEIDIQPYIECMKMGFQNLPNGTKVGEGVQPNSKNCLAEESCFVWNNGKICQDMRLKLRNVECGEVEVQIECIDLHGHKSSRS
ncbi:protein C2-DOMAIN ABA-RELATED 7-like [Camellia sinensis]|uniref:protein C2-DOMAIN ABA-RELATED 7-like n=1 Tax=Camellia sinensis TaxID=4442 RepID=UPI001036D308|nr:protein C2-DOMAIN ABA-RELATED 7-like [Camellia sinensis]